MWRVAILGLLVAGCATGPRYTGPTSAQARWQPHMDWCRSYVEAPGADQRVVAECRAQLAQARAEDAAEREAIQESWQEQPAPGVGVHDALQALSVGLAPRPVAPVKTGTSCTSTAIGGTVFTNCN